MINQIEVASINIKYDYYLIYLLTNYTLSSRIGKVVASRDEGCGVDSRPWLH